MAGAFRFFNLLLIAVALGTSGHADPVQKKGPTCDETMAPKERKARPEKIEFSETSTHWFTTVELGFHDKWIMRDPKTGRRHMVVYKGDIDPDLSMVALKDVEIMPGAPDGGSSYYAQMSIDQSTHETSAKLFGIQHTDEIGQMLDRNLDLTWETYELDETVSKEEIGEFKVTERKLSPQRKVTFVISSKDGRTLGVMRVYDGSPYPAMFFGPRGMHLEAPDTDQRVPVERRYPHINFREESDWVFEAGRLAKRPGIGNVLEYQFYHFGGYLLSKFGFLGLSPVEYHNKGRVYIEITSRHLDVYMKSRKAKGMGFTLFAADQGHGMQKVAKDTTYDSLGINPKDRKQKFILYMSIFDFVNNFHVPIRTGTASEAYPNLYK